MEKLKQHVRDAVQEFLRREPGLLKSAAHEQAIAHRIAVCLEGTLSKTGSPQLNVDCEYNKHLKTSKAMSIDLNYFRQFPACRCNACNKLRKEPAEMDTLPDKQFRPDVLVHHRGDDTMNLIAMEIKRRHVCPFDLAKLKGLTQPINADGYGYQLGVFLWFPNHKPQFRWFPEQQLHP